MKLLCLPTAVLVLTHLLLKLLIPMVHICYCNYYVNILIVIRHRHQPLFQKSNNGMNVKLIVSIKDNYIDETNIDVKTGFKSVVLIALVVCFIFFSVVLCFKTFR